jgi:hypothetical protein
MRFQTPLYSINGFAVHTLSGIRLNCIGERVDICRQNLSDLLKKLDFYISSSFSFL